jgi:hypothetical protein
MSPTFTLVRHIPSIEWRAGLQLPACIKKFTASFVHFPVMMTNFQGENHQG